MGSSPNGDDTSSAGSWSPEIKSRWRFTTDQNDILEGVYKENPNPPSDLVESLVTELHSPRKTIITWFQNRRAKERRYQRQRRQGTYDQLFVHSSHGTMLGSSSSSSSSSISSSSSSSQGASLGPTHREALSGNSSSSLSLQAPVAAEATAVMATMQLQQHEAEMLTPLGVLLPHPSPQILSHETFWHHDHLDDNRPVHTSSVPTDEWSSFSAQWHYVHNLFEESDTYRDL